MKLNGKAPQFETDPPPAIHQGWAQFLLATTNVLTDAYAAALRYAQAQHGDAIKPEDVLSLMTIAYQQMTKHGGPNVT